MNLILDIGNSAAKVAVFGGRQAVFRAVIAEPTAQAIRDVAGEYVGKVERAIVSTTRNPDPALEAQVERWVSGRLIRFDAATPIPLQNDYQTPQTLGPDRLAAAVGAWERSDRETELLVVDFGTAITIDRVGPPGIYRGGNISPGLAMRLGALHGQTARLPLIHSEEIGNEQYGYVGWDTRSAIVGGVVQGIVHEIAGYIDRISAEKSPFALFFTGRDAEFFADKLKKPIFVANDLVMGGLNAILEHNTGR